MAKKKQPKAQKVFRSFGFDKLTVRQRIAALCLCLLAVPLIFGLGYLSETWLGVGRATEFLEARGFTNVVHVKTKRLPLMLRCSDHDLSLIRHWFEVTEPNGERSQITLCGGPINFDCMFYVDDVQKNDPYYQSSPIRICTS